MSIWSTLGKIGAGIAAPFTGGASLAAIPAIDGLSKASAGAASSMANNRGAKGAMLLDEQDQFEKQLMARELEKRQAQSAAYKNSIMGSMAANWKPANRPTGIPVVSFGGGNDMSQAAGNTLYSQSMQRLSQPDLANPSALAPLQRLRDTKDFNGTLNSSFWEKLLGIGSVAASAYGAFKPKDGQ